MSQISLMSATSKQDFVWKKLFGQKSGFAAKEQLYNTFAKTKN
jgi:hypothetical protein